MIMKTVATCGPRCGQTMSQIVDGCNMITYKSQQTSLSVKLQGHIIVSFRQRLNIYLFNAAHPP